MTEGNWKPTWFRCINGTCGATEHATGAAPTCRWCGGLMAWYEPSIAVKASGQVAQGGTENPTNNLSLFVRAAVRPDCLRLLREDMTYGSYATE